MTEQVQKETPLAPCFVRRLTESQFELYAFVCTLLANRQDAQDVLQDANVVLMRHAGDYDTSRPFLPWAKAFVYNQARAYLKRQSRSRLVFDEELMADVAGVLSETVSESGRELDLLDACMERLTPEQRGLIQSRYYQGEGIEPLAERLHRSAISVYVQIHRIRNRLGACIEAGLRAIREEAGV